VDDDVGWARMKDLSRTTLVAINSNNRERVVPDGRKGA
jgi:hypothetical protein